MTPDEIRRLDEDNEQLGAALADARRRLAVVEALCDSSQDPYAWVFLDDLRAALAGNQP